MKKSDLDTNWKMYKSFFPTPTFKQRIWEAKSRAVGWEKAYFPQLRKLERCHICKKQEDLIFDFAKLIPFLDKKVEKVLFICRDHGGKTGGLISNAFSGDREFIFPAQYWIIVKIKNVSLRIFLKILITIRFIWFLVKDWYVEKMWDIRIKLIRFFLPE